MDRRKFSLKIYCTLYFFFLDKSNEHMNDNDSPDVDYTVNSVDVDRKTLGDLISLGFENVGKLLVRRQSIQPTMRGE